MSGITSAFCTSAKSELMSGAWCFQATITPTGDTHTTTTVDSLSSNAGIAVGMTITESHGDIPANTIVAAISSATAIVLSKAATASHTGGTLTLVGDVIKAALFKNGVAGTYGAATTNYSNMTGNSDEVGSGGSGYTTGGVSLTNTSPTTSGTTGYITFGANPSWTSATFSTDGCMIYNSSTRLGDGSTSGTGRTMGVFSFGGTQTVTAGTISIILPAASSSTAIFRIA